MTWRSGELRIPNHRDQELHLDGRGLLLIPSYFCLTGPLTMFDPTLPPVLVYPVARQPDALPTNAQRLSEPLGALIGTTRAAVLDTISGHHATTTVLRHAGLITSHRDRNRMLHHPTALGLALLNRYPGRAARPGSTSLVMPRPTDRETAAIDQDL